MWISKINRPVGPHKAWLKKNRPRTDTDEGEPGTAAGISQSLILNGTMAYLASSENAGVAKLADAPDLGSGGAILRGSSPLSGIKRRFLKYLAFAALRPLFLDAFRTDFVRNGGC
jgi:hypothetical protein